MAEQPNPSRYRSLYACSLAVCLAAVHITLIVKIDNTNLTTTNGLWKTPDVYRWEHATGTPVDSGGFLYLPTYGYLSRLIPDRLVSYGVHGDVVTYRKLAILNAMFGALASSAVFLLALRISGSMLVALIVSLAHASSAFVLLNSLNSEDVIPAYAFFTASAALLLEYLITRRSSFLLLAAVPFGLTTLFHWTLMIPGAAAIGSVLIADIRREKRRIWSALVFLLGFLAVIKGSLLVLRPLSSHALSVWDVIYPNKASAQSGYLGIRWEKVPYVLIGIGNYFCGGFNLSNYNPAFASPRVLGAMAFSWFYMGITGAACVWALSTKRLELRSKLMALFGITVFWVGELEHFYSQPQDPQSQIQPMFITVIGLAILLSHLKGSWLGNAFRVLGAALVVLFAANAAVNLHFLFLTRGSDSTSVRDAKKFADLFPPLNTTVVSHGFEGWNTWLFLVVYNGNHMDFNNDNILLATPFTTHPGISAPAAADLIEDQIEIAFDAGHRVVAGKLWTEKPQQFVASLTTVTDSVRAKAFYDSLRPAFDVGSGWDTPYGRFVELRRNPKEAGTRSDWMTGPDGWPKSVRVRLGPEQGQEFSLLGESAHQLFRSDMDSTADWSINRYGRSGGLGVRPNCFAVGDSCGTYSSGDQRDHLASPFLDLPSYSGILFFSVWAKSLGKAELPELILQQADYSPLAHARPVMTRPDGWVLLAGWAETNQQQKVRIVVIEKPKADCLLDKGLVVESMGHSPGRATPRNSP